MESGGGGVYDIGCYLIHASRYAFKQEPLRVVACLDRDPEMNVDRLGSGILEFAGGHAIFTCSTQLIPYQRIHFLGTRGRIELEVPFNAPPDRPTRMFIDSTGDLSGSGIATEIFPTGDQYTMQGEAFAKAVREDTDVPVSLEDSIGNMAVIEAVFNSARTNQWVVPQK
jgi:predicted dehydrogenase